MKTDVKSLGSQRIEISVTRYAAINCIVLQNHSKLHYRPIFITIQYEFITECKPEVVSQSEIHFSLWD